MDCEDHSPQAVTETGNSAVSDRESVRVDSVSRESFVRKAVCGAIRATNHDTVVLAELLVATVWAYVVLFASDMWKDPKIFTDYGIANVAVTPFLLVTYCFYKFYPRYAFRIETVKVLISYANHILAIMYMVVLSKCYTGHHEGQIDDDFTRTCDFFKPYKCTPSFEVINFLNFFYHSIVMLWRLKVEWEHGFPYLSDLVTCCGRAPFWMRCTCSIGIPGTNIKVTEASKEDAKVIDMQPMPANPLHEGTAEV